MNGGRRRYRACPADKAAVRRARRPKPSKLASCARLRMVVESKLELRWSPTQISGWLVEEFPEEPEMRVSRETNTPQVALRKRARLPAPARFRHTKNPCLTRRTLEVCSSGSRIVPVGL